MIGTPAPGATARLRIIYRSHGGENAKSRPGYYSKLLGLASVVRAVQESGASPQVIYWNDGPIPGDRLELMRSSGEVVQIKGGSNRRSYRAAIDMAVGSDWGPTDLVWFAEDDYLYRPESFRMLIDGATALPQADYLSVFGGLALDLTNSRTEPRWFPHLGAVDVPDPIDVGGVRWFRGVSTTSTFGVRYAVLAQDRRLLRLVPYSGGSWDHTTCVSVQGMRPFHWAQIRRELLPFGSLPLGQWPSSVARGLIRTGVNLRSRRSAERHRTLYLCDPVGAMHMELPATGSNLDWEALAGQARAWAVSQGIPMGTDRHPQGVPQGSTVGDPGPSYGEADVALGLGGAGVGSGAMGSDAGPYSDTRLGSDAGPASDTPGSVPAAGAGPLRSENALRNSSDT
jgi:hypothetical protein